MKNSILLSDLLLLTKLYAPKNVALFVFDPFERLTIDVDFPLTKVNENSFKLLVNLADEIICYKGMQLSEFDLIVDFGKSNMPSVFCKKELSYINSPEKGMRWVYGNKNKQASFLNFYNTATTRAKVIAKSIKLAFRLGLQNLVRSGSFTIYHQKELNISPLINQIRHTDYSLFMGTPGPDRTLLLELNSEGETTHFIKIPANKKSAMAIVKEEVNIRLLNSKKFKTFNTPKIAYNKFKDVLIIKNIRPKNASRSNTMLHSHFIALSEVARETTQFYHLKSTNYWEVVMNNLSQLKKVGKYAKVVGQINQLKDELNGVRSVYTSLSHGDFTPWNIYVGNEKIHIYDLEQSSNQIPLLNDLFHFHFQSGILSKEYQ